MMCECHLAGARHAPPADHRDHRRGVMRAAERAMRDEPRILPEQSRDAVDLRDLDRLFLRHLRQNRTHAAREHRLARARHADHEDVMTARRCNLQGAFRLILSLHISEVVCKDGVFRWLCLCGNGRRQCRFPCEMANELREILYSIDAQAVDEQRLIHIPACNIEVL